MVTDKASALALQDSPDTHGSTLASADDVVKLWGDPNESRSYLLEDCVLYAPFCRGAQIYSGDTGNQGETIIIRDCVAVHVGSNLNSNAVFDLGSQGAGWNNTLVEGTGDAGDGPLNCVAVMSTGWHALYVHQSATHPTTLSNSTIKNAIVCVNIDTTTAEVARPISGGSGNNLTLSDLILHGKNGSVIVDGISAPVTWTRITFQNDGAAYFGVGGRVGFDASAKVTVRDSIFSGLSSQFGVSVESTAKFGGTQPVLGFDFDYCAFPTSGPDKIGLWIVDTTWLVSVIGSNTVTQDPQYRSKVATDALFLDVGNTFYRNKNSTAGPLAGGADFSPAITLNPTPPLVLTQGNSVVLQVINSIGPYSNWSSSNPAVGSLSGIGGDTAVISALSLGTTQVSVTDGNGYTFTSSNIIVVPTSAPLVPDYSMVPSNRKDTIRFDLYQ
jgi:hypothetical protein